MTLAPDPFRSATHGERHSAYTELNDRGPVHLVRQTRSRSIWLVTGYEEARACLTDPRLVKGGGSATIFGHRLDPALLAATRTEMLSSDPPDHTRLRKLVSGAFTMRRIDQLRPSHPGDRRRTARRPRRRRVGRSRRRVRLSVADDGDLRAAGHPGGAAGRLPHLVLAGHRPGGERLRDLRRRGRGTRRVRARADRDQAGGAGRRPALGGGRRAGRHGPAVGGRADVDWWSCC